MWLLWSLSTLSMSLNDIIAENIMLYQSNFILSKHRLHQLDFLFCQL